MNKQIMVKEASPAAGPYSHAVEAEGLLFVSGQTGHTKDGTLRASIEEQTGTALENIGVILRGCGYAYEDVVKTTVFIKDMKDFAAVNRVYASYFGSTKPARSCVAVADLPVGASIEIECIAYKR